MVVKLLFFKIVVFILIFLNQITKIFGIDQTFTFFAYQSGIQNLKASDDYFMKNTSYLNYIVNQHGKGNKDFVVSPSVLSFDFYRVSNFIASGFGVETTRYSNNFKFKDNSNIDLSVYGLLYGFNFFYRGDFWFPFFGFGTGNYNAKITENIFTNGSLTNNVLFGQVDSPFYYKFGFRVPLNSWGFQYTQQYTSANMNVETINKEISLGGISNLFGVFIGF